jgi:serine/threonine protein kinase/predicted TPR repeat methyltransferase
VKAGDCLDEFQVTDRLGAGGFGTVYLARDTSLDRLVAIKELHALAADDSEAVKRFLQEARTAGNLSHPHIVTVYSLRSRGNSEYLILEYVSGGSLRDRLKQEGNLTLEEALRIAAEVCDALAAVHAKGIVHRDIKPENILLTDDGRAKVTDFGIAHVPRSAGGTSLTRTGFPPGTIMYMSPEQIRGEDPTGKSDVYQVGAVLLEMLTGSHYFDPDALLRQAMREMGGTNPDAPAIQARWMLLVTQKISTPLDLDSKLPPELAGLINTAMASRPDYRPDALELGEALTHIPITAAAHPVGAVPDVHPCKSDSRDAWIRLERGYSNLDKGDIAQAIADFARAIELDPKEAWAWGSRGVTYAAKGEYDQAIADLTRAIELDPREAWCWVARGDARIVKGEYALAIADFGRAIDVDPDFAWAWVARGDALRTKAEFDQAIGEYNHALDLDPALSWAWSGRGKAREANGEFYQAAGDFSRALELDPAFSWVWSRRGMEHRLDGVCDQAIANITRHIELDPTSEFAWAERGMVHTAKGDLVLAISDFDKALELDPKQYLIWAARGEAYQIMGRYDAAVEDLSRAVELTPSYARARSLLIEARAHGSSKREAT